MERDLCLKWCNETNSEFKAVNRKKTNKNSDNRQIVQSANSDFWNLRIKGVRN